MADKFLMRCGLLVCGVLLAATVPAYAESGCWRSQLGRRGSRLRSPARW